MAGATLPLAALLLVAMTMLASSAQLADRPSAKLASSSSRSSRWRKGFAALEPDPTCPWATAAGERAKTPEELAFEVLSRMSLADKLDLVVLRYDGPYENALPGIPSLCIPTLILQDGAAGIAYNATGVTQLPAPLGVAASFDTSLAYDYGRVEGEEARGKGIDVVQGPSLNIDRVPEGGRAFETYGEDPSLVSAMGVADTEGIQSTGVIAEATHLSAYTQETDRTSLDQIVSQRALEELYLAPFRADVEQAHVGSVMCAYGKINGVRTCEEDQLFDELYSWGFDGFLRSDLDAVTNSVAAFDAGVDAIKPASANQLERQVALHALQLGRLDEAVAHVLEAMFRFGLIEHPLPEEPSARVDPPSHAAFALHAAEESMVLLKNAGALLPLSGHLASIAVIGSDADNGAMTAGQGSAHVLAPFVSTPLSAIESRLGARTRVSYVAGPSPSGPLPAIPASEVRSQRVDLEASELLGRRSGRLDDPSGPLRVLEQLVHGGATGTGSIPPQDFKYLDRRVLNVEPKSTGLYAISLTERGDAWLSLDGTQLLADSGEHVRSSWQVSSELV
ncbi:MAG TPA: glycoside hydrolase family 3 N-terminal domain-containing protein, partial [Acidimicrobiales bacterium]|nr:glycoside hydrolase family 3 N-terminal domain-containing protein [Acidimicrobiales bacterium]